MTEEREGLWGDRPRGDEPRGDEPPGDRPPGDERRRSVFPGLADRSLRRQQVVSDLADARRRHGLTQTEVAAQMGTSQSAVARLEAGDADVRLSTLDRYAAAVGARLEWRVAQRLEHEKGEADAQV